MCSLFIQATFGPTRESIQALTSTSNDFASWVSDQMSLTPSSHRGFYRRRTNPKYEFPYHVGATGPRPCELHSRWRRYALTSRDQLSNRKTGWNKHLTVEFDGTKYVWRVDGHFRTVTAGPPELVDGTEMALGAKWRIEHNNHNTWKSDCVGKYKREIGLRSIALSIQSRPPLLEPNHARSWRSKTALDV